jgi:predicted SAM-dependent methyltransferase
MKINIGCGGRPLLGYINIDSDNINVLKCRYPDIKFSDDLKIYDYDIFNLPFKDNSVYEVRADSLIEHLSFKEEPLFFYEIKRVLKSGGKFCFSTTNFEKIIKLWLKADDNWKDFFRDDVDAIKNQH